MSIIRRGVFFVLLAVTVVGTAACENTIRGAGRDVGNTADAVEDAADSAAN